jgi:GDP-L-fucose synthase
MVGSAIAEQARSDGWEVIGKSSRELDLTDRSVVFHEINQTSPDALIIAAAKVGGIGANSSLPVDFLSINLQIQTNLLDAAHAAKTSRVLFLGSACIYPKFAPQPITEKALLTGELEPTNDAYAIAKIAGLKLVEAYRRQFSHRWISAMPTNLYGPGDNFNLEFAHVLPALIHRFHKAKVENLPTVQIWGDGSPLREFLHVNDLAVGCMKMLETYDGTEIVNIGTGEEISISNLAHLVAKTVGYAGEILFDLSKPNGTPRRLLDNSKIFEIGWRPKIDIEDGIASTYQWFLTNPGNGLNK